MIKSIWYSTPKWYHKVIRAIAAPFAKHAGKIDWRNGRRFKITQDKKDQFMMRVRPGRIILTHTDYNLANILIPGFFDHVAIVVDSEYCVQATSKGVHRKRIRDLLDECDTAALLSPKFVSIQKMKKASQYALGQLGKEYDYDFEYRLEGNEKFYCSELGWWAYDQLFKPGAAPFTPKWILGRWTLSPQDYWDAKDKWNRDFCTNKERLK
jgi:uncharacterized protein YycO